MSKPMYQHILESIALHEAPSDIDAELQGLPASARTQIKTTVGSYRTAADYAANVLRLSASARVLDYGSGLGYGTQALREKFPNTDNYEMFPAKAVEPPKYLKPEAIPGNRYDLVVCLNVLNVIPRPRMAVPEDPDEAAEYWKKFQFSQLPMRDQAVAHILRVLKVGGKALIGVRSWSGDLSMQQSNFADTDPDDPHAGWFQSGTERWYQKGFDLPGLSSYLAEVSELYGLVQYNEAGRPPVAFKAAAFTDIGAIRSAKKITKAAVQATKAKAVFTPNI